MSLNQLTSPTYKPELDLYFDSLVLTNSTSGLLFQPQAGTNSSLSGNSVGVVSSSPASNRIYTIPDVGADVKFQLGCKSVVTGTATSSLSVSQAGSVVFIASAAAASTYTLPTPASGNIGASFRFVVAGSLSNAATITGGASKIKGCIVAGDATATGQSTGSTNCIFGTSSAVGDTVEFISDGSLWYAYGQIAVHSTLTFS